MDRWALLNSDPGPRMLSVVVRRAQAWLSQLEPLNNSVSLLDELR